MACNADINSDDYYKVLGVNRKASESELGKAYKKLALKHHPDKNPDRKEQAEEDFKKITEAYDVLRCPEKREVYDQVGKSGLTGGNPQSGEHDFSVNTSGGPRQSNMSREDADRIFKMFFSGGDSFTNLFGNHDDGNVNFVFQPAGRGRSGFGGVNGFGSTDDVFRGSDFARGFSRSRGRSQSRPPRGQRQHVHACGVAVVIHSLTKSPEHNGKHGHIMKWDKMRGRYQVRLMLGDEHVWVGDDSLWLRPENITQLCKIEVTGLISKPELNGQKGEIFNYDEVRRRYKVLVGENAAILLQPANCILSSGTCILINGLSKSECNGQHAVITDVDRIAARYVVELENGTQIKIKYENVLC